MRNKDVQCSPLRFGGLSVIEDGSVGKESPCSAGDAGSWVQSMGQEDCMEKGTATPSSVPAWRIPWTEEPGGLQSMGSQRVRHNWTTEHTHIAIEGSIMYTYCILDFSELKANPFQVKGQLSQINTFLLVHFKNYYKRKVWVINRVMSAMPWPAASSPEGSASNPGSWILGHCLEFRSDSSSLDFLNRQRTNPICW